MGVPKFYRFISERYPLINSPLRPETAPTIDNLYLDMNGIIHNCVRQTPGNGNDTKRFTTNVPSPVKTPAQIYLDVFKYIENIFSSLPPRRLLYMAIDGVAPRAKMNQQRARRFRSVQEREMEHQRNIRNDPMYAAADVEPFDSNCITPGTSFMYGLTNALRYFVAKKVTEDARWASIQIILSGAEAPGEGEHKIMEYIRAVRESGNLIPNSRHCVYGLDADLIMLGLITHEPHFFILREKVDYNFWRKKNNPRMATQLDMTIFGEFELLSIGLVREYLALDLGAGSNSQLPYFDVERITDDFVFILMLIGNDFLPNLPTLDIADGTLHVLLHVYKRLLPVMGGYLTYSGKIHPERLEFFFAKLGMVEQQILSHKKEERENQEHGGRRGQHKPLANVNLDEFFKLTGGNKPPAYMSNNPKKLLDLARTTRMNSEKKDMMRDLKKEYYRSKFGADFLASPEKLADLIKNYVEGISWTLKYYTEGCRQWRWFYPFHYAPLASDIMNVSRVLLSYDSSIKRDRPFQPLEQLLSVLPPKSAWCLPPAYRPLMISKSSPIRDHYPDHFDIDMNGKRNDWEAVVLLPFVDEKRLVAAIKSVPKDRLSTTDIQRGKLGFSYVYTHTQTVQETLPSPFGTLPPVMSHAKGVKLTLPVIKDGLPFRPRLLPGTKEPFSTSELEDLPTLKTMKHSGNLAAIGVNVFGMPSRSESLCLKMKLDEGSSNSAASKTKETSAGVLALEKRGIMPGSHVWYGYPWRQTGVVVGVSDETLTRELAAGPKNSKKPPNVIRIEERKTRKLNFAEEVNALVSKLEQRYAVIAPVPTCVAKIKRDESEKENDEADGDALGAVYDKFILGKKEKEKKSVNSPKTLHTGQVVLYTGKGEYFGHKCRVIAVGPRDSIKVSFDRSSSAAREPPFGYLIVDKSRQREWLTLSRLAKAVQLNTNIVDLFLGSVRVKISSKEEIDIGLGVKYIGRSLYVPGYAKPDNRYNFVFSESAANVLKDYKSNFPGLFSNIERWLHELETREEHPRGQIVFNPQDLFGNTKKAESAARAAATWLSVQDIASQPLLPTSSVVLPKETILEMEKNVHIISRLQTEYEKTMDILPTDKHIRGVSRDVLIDASATNTVDQYSSKVYPPVPKDGSGLRLGDRVVNRNGGGSVPFALRGTVVGFHDKAKEGKRFSKEAGEYSDVSKSGEKELLVEVVFDEGFFGGGSLNGRCSKNRGKVVPANSLYIIRPNRDNQYYSTNYNRVTSWFNRVLEATENRRDGPERRNKTIADAAVQSYADALKKPIAPIEPVRSNLSGMPAKSGPSRIESSPKYKYGNSQTGDRKYNAEMTKPIPNRSLPFPSFVKKENPGNGTLGRDEVKNEVRSEARVERSTKQQKKIVEKVENGTQETAMEAKKLTALLRSALGIGKEEVSTSNSTQGEANPFTLTGSKDRNLEGGLDDDDEFAFQWESLQKEAQGGFHIIEDRA